MCPAGSRWKFSGGDLSALAILRFEVHQKEYQQFDRELRRKSLPPLRAGAGETLDYLKGKGFVLGLLSSRNEEDLGNELKKFQIGEYFTAVIGTESIVHDGTKAEKKNEAISQKMGITDPGEVLYVGDLVTDIKNARDYSWKIASISGAWQADQLLLENKPDYFLKEEVSDLMSVL